MVEPERRPCCSSKTMRTFDGSRRACSRHGAIPCCKQATGAQALEILEGFRDRVHLLLTDVVLPRMGGRQLAERVVVRRPDIRVLYMSGYSDDVVLQHRLTEHGVVLLQKPFTADTLVRKLQQALAARPTEAMSG